MIQINWFNVIATVCIVALVFGAAWFVAYVAFLSQLDRRAGDGTLKGKEARKNVKREW